MIWKIGYISLKMDSDQHLSNECINEIPKHSAFNISILNTCLKHFTVVRFPK